MKFKNVAGQGVYIFARDTVAMIGKTGDAANITVNISLDGGTAVESDTTSTGQVTEVGGGFYWCPLQQAEMNADDIAIYGSSTTANVVIDPIEISTTGGAIPKVDHGQSGGLGTVLAGNLIHGVQGVNTKLDDLAGPDYDVTLSALDKQASVEELAEAIVEAMSNMYQVKSFKFLRDPDNIPPRDEYRSIIWYRNDTPLETGVSLATIEVRNADNGTMFIAQQSLTEIAAGTGIYKYDAIDAERIPAKQAYTVVFRARIDNADRVSTLDIGKEE